jgi:hypothetical protein
MSEKDFAEAVQQLVDDEEVRAKVAAGDLSPFEHLDLDDEQRALLEGGASEFPEVVGNDINVTFLGLQVNLPKKIRTIHQDVTVNKAKTADKAYTAMDGFIKG